MKLLLITMSCDIGIGVGAVMVVHMMTAPIVTLGGALHVVLIKRSPASRLPLHKLQLA